MQLDLNELQKTEDMANYALLLERRQIGQLKLFLATKEEAASFKKYLKKKFKQGQPFSAKIYLDDQLDEPSLKAILGYTEEKFPDAKGKVYLLRKEGEKLTPLKLG